jgi:hypothetical protein
LSYTRAHRSESRNQKSELRIKWPNPPPQDFSDIRLLNSEITNRAKHGWWGK